MKRVVIAGGTGFIGKALVKAFGASGYEVTVLSRSGKAVEGASGIQWDGKSLGPWTESLEDAHAIVNLCGENLLQRWTAAAKVRMRDSRIDTALLIGQAVASCKAPPAVWLNASAVGWYGDTGNREVSEGAPPSDDFLGKLCQDWEAAVDKTPTPRTTKTKVRIGVVFGQGSEAFGRLVCVTKMLLGGPMGSGKQFLPWIHIHDLASLFVWAADNRIDGAINGTGPNPATNETVMSALRKRFGMPPSPPAPTFAIEAVCKVMGWDAGMLLGGSKVIPAIALARGFKFAFPTIESALDNLIDDVPAAWKSGDSVAA